MTNHPTNPHTHMSTEPANLTKPCSGCPFSRKCQPGALGGSSPTTFIGQAFASMWLPCHMLYDPSKSAKDQDARQCGQCAGAAIFRANCKIRVLPGIKVLPSDTDAVFASPEEFLAHHSRLPLAVAADFLKHHTTYDLAVHELRKAGVRVQVVPR
jgi:hypothetical protein